MRVASIYSSNDDRSRLRDGAMGLETNDLHNRPLQAKSKRGSEHKAPKPLNPNPRETLTWSEEPGGGGTSLRVPVSDARTERPLGARYAPLPGTRWAESPRSSPGVTTSSPSSPPPTIDTAPISCSSPLYCFFGGGGGGTTMDRFIHLRHVLST